MAPTVAIGSIETNCNGKSHLDRCMDKLLNFGLLGIAVSAVVRYFWAKVNDLSYLDVHSLENWELWLYGISALVAVAWFWHVLIRTRCPNCRSTAVVYRGERELDRWVGTKKVTEQLSGGKSTTRSVSTTFEKVQKLYRCADCGHEWASSPIKREKQ